MNSMIKKLTNHFVVNGVIGDEDREICHYGLYQGILIIANIITTILIGFLFKMVWQSILFLISYIPLRTFGGGYHAKTEVRCYLFSIALTSTVLLAIRLIPLTDFIILGLIGIGGSIVLGLAPVDDSNKPLNQTEKRIYKRMVSIILIIEILTSISLLILSFSEIALVIAISICVLGSMLVLGRIRLVRVTKDNK